jgi:tetratricopeptide (TPR) repeat protein
MAIRLDPEDLVAYNNLGLVYEKLGYKEKSKRSFEKADQKLSNGTKPNTDEAAGFPEIKKRSSIAKDAVSNKAKFKATGRSLNYMQTLKNVFSTKTGFADFISFLKGKPK